MFKIQTLNKISSEGLKHFPLDNYEVSSEIAHPDAILVRSFNMLEMELPPTLKVIARAGTGVNNIPVERCSEKGVVVFNTPGANANSVKELVLAGLFLCSRKIVDSIIWAKELIGKGNQVKSLIEKNKSQFTGPEIKGKNLGVIGLGAIGVAVANDAAALGMKVTGYDPFISVESAWSLSRDIKRATGFENLLSTSEYISLHIPLTEETRGIINADKFSIMKKGVRLLNFARGELVNNYDLKKAIEEGIVSIYVTDFPDEELLEMENVIAIPHLGASTPEAEDNCARMAVMQIREFLEAGNIKNSVNFPSCYMDRSGKCRIVVANKNIPHMVERIASTVASEGINIADMLNRSLGNLAYNIIDVDSDIKEETVNKIRDIQGILMVRVI